MKTTALLKKINQALQVLEEARAFIEAQTEAPVLAKSTAKPSTTKPASKSVSKKQTAKRTMSEEGRARVSEAQRKRWAAAKKASKKQVK